MSKLKDGTIVPHFLGVSSGPGPSTTALSMNDLRLRIGRIVAVYPPDSNANSNKKFFEYDVEVDVGAGLTKVYPRAVMMDPLGGIADTFNFTPRISQGGQGQVDAGTRVLLMCINGQGGHAVIIGGAKHFGRTEKEDKADGHNMVLEFNGINISINKDGDLTILHKGATDAKGKVTDDSEDTNGTKIVLDKNGDVLVSAGKNGNASIQLDSKNKHVVVKADATLIGDATDHMMLGDTFRNAQKQMHQELKAQLQQASTALGIASSLLTTAGAAMAVPISGAVAAGPQITSASVQLKMASTALGQMNSAISTFESGGPYLSDSNKND